MSGETVHACPEDGAAVTGCCGKTPFELPLNSRMTLDPALVTCPRPAAPGDGQRCPATHRAGFGPPTTIPAVIRKCDLPAGHDGPHVTNDGCGRSEYYWAAAPAAGADAATDGLREQIVTHLQRRFSPPGPLGFATRDWRIEADDLLALPALRDLAAAAERVRRVEARHVPIDGEDVGPEGPFPIKLCAADHDHWPCDVRRTLDGEVSG